MTSPSHATEQFLGLLAERSQHAPLAVARAPGRVNLIGDHIDYCGGPVLPIALPHACHAAILPESAKQGTLRITSTSNDDTVTIPADRPLEPGRDAPIGSWASYAIGAIAEVQEMTPLTRLAGCELLVHTDIPIGAGLSSSAALEVSVALAASGALDLDLAGLDLARRCRRAEHRFAGMPCGLMDQAASVLSKAGHALLLNCADETYRHVPLPESAGLLVIDSGVRHTLAGGAYAERWAMCVSASERLGVEHLAHAELDAVETLPERLRPIARHVITESERVRRACEAFEQADLPRAGQLMLESHASLRDDIGVSCAEIDTLVDRLQTVKGVHGLRMTGGGFGGSIVVLVQRGSEQPARTAAEQCRDVCPNLAIIEAIPSDGASLIAPSA